MRLMIDDRCEAGEEVTTTVTNECHHSKRKGTEHASYAHLLGELGLCPRAKELSFFVFFLSFVFFAFRLPRTPFMRGGLALVFLFACVFRQTGCFIMNIRMATMGSKFANTLALQTSRTYCTSFLASTSSSR